MKGYTHTRFLFSLFWLSICLLPTQLFAFQSNESSDGSESNMGLYMLSSQYETLLEYRINERLTQYFPSSSFIVTVELNMFKDEESLSNQINPDENNDDTRLYTAVPQFLLTELDEPNLTAGEDIVRSLGVYLTNIVVRTNLSQSFNFSIQDEAFIRFAIESIIKFNPERGDQILIQNRLFPQPIATSFDNVNLGNNEMDQRMLSFADSLRAFSGFNSSGNGELMAMTASLQNRMNLLFIAIALLFGGGIAYVVSSRSTKGNDIAGGSSYVINPGLRDGMREDIAVSTNMVRNLSHTIKNEGLIEYAISQTDSKEDRELESLRFIMKLTSERPTDMARILEYWFGSDKNKTIQVILSVDIKIMIMLRPYITKEVYKELVGVMNTYYEKQDFEQAYTLEELAREIKGFEQPNSFIFKYQPVKDFNFIQLMKLEELKELIELLELDDTALVMSHCSQEMVQRIGEMLETEYLNEVIKQTYQIQKIPLSEYRARSNYIFKEIHLNQNPDFVPESLVSDVASIIEGLNIEKQQEIVRYLSNDEHSYTKGIIERVITLDAILDLEDEEIMELISPIKLETLAYAIRSFGSELQKKIIGMRPEREQVFIENTMNNSQVSLKQIKIAQYELLDRLKKALKKKEEVHA